MTQERIKIVRIRIPAETMDNVPLLKAHPAASSKSKTGSFLSDKMKVVIGLQFSVEVLNV
jgi:hypothetical protein